ncbi:MAG TPA: ATP-binding protein [Desulfomonilaceae bacterium]|nr:ATP-binding protein [Desulfomonilaceae bacterium]
MQDLSLHVLDVAENGVSAGADLIEITIEEDVKSDRLRITIKDNGKGMKPEFLARVLDPFVTTRTTRKVGLGLSLFQQAAQEAEGDLHIESTPGTGTTVSVLMRYHHIDRKPMGSMPDTIVTLIQGNPEVDFVYSHTRDGREYLLDTREIRAELEGIAVNHPEVVSLIRENLISGLAEIAVE